MSAVNSILSTAFQKVAEDVSEGVGKVGISVKNIIKETAKNADDSVTAVLRAEHLNHAKIKSLRASAETTGEALALLPHQYHDPNDKWIQPPS